MDKTGLFDRIKGKLIISCQALPGEPLYDPERSLMPYMARAAGQSGSPMIRANSVRDVTGIKKETGLPVIGLIKQVYEGYEGYITPTMKEVDALVEAGADIIAMDCTDRKHSVASTRNSPKSIITVPATEIISSTVLPSVHGMPSCVSESHINTIPSTAVLSRRGSVLLHST